MKPKTIKILYWTFNGLFALAMLFTCYDSIMVSSDQVVQPGSDGTGPGEQSIAFIHGMLGYPVYVIPFTAWMKVIGCLIILLPIRSRIKEWAYAGLSLDLLLALYSIIMALGVFPETVIMMSIYIILAATAYFFHIKKQELDGQAV